ncbi:MAG TPA: cyclic dehypoxanthinyl futalosine synthase [Blastocatellia bacterium]|nr:cyclic dehypoxanthinyl futalosine synthase [Blastocatellia bacterium]
MNAIERATRDGLLERIEARERLTFEEWQEVEDFASTEELGRLADDLRRALHPDDVVTYIVDRNVNYSNVCVSVCSFCAFYRKPGSPEGYVHSYDEIFRKVEEMRELGGSGVLMQGGLHPDLPLDYYTGLLRELKTRYKIHLHCFSPPEIDHLGKITGLGVEGVLRELRAAGLDSIPGGGGEILVDEIRRKRRTHCNTEEWLNVMDIAHTLGIPTTATMMFGMGETRDQRLMHFERLRELQERNPGFVSFIPWTLQPDNTPIGKRFPDRISGDDYLRWLAIGRLYLSNIPNVQVSWLTQGLDVGRQGLHYGANDLGSTMIEENVITPAGANHRATEMMLREAIVAEGFKPVKRRADYVRLAE